MRTYIPLQTRYEKAFFDLHRERQLVESLFCEVLDIPDCSLENLADELEELRRNNFQDFDIIYRLYDYLQGLIKELDKEDRRAQYLRYVPTPYSSQKLQDILILRGLLSR